MSTSLSWFLSIAIAAIALEKNFATIVQRGGHKLPIVNGCNPCEKVITNYELQITNST